MTSSQYVDSFFLHKNIQSKNTPERITATVYIYLYLQLTKDYKKYKEKTHDMTSSSGFIFLFIRKHKNTPEAQTFHTES